MITLQRRRRKPSRGPDQAEAYRDWIRQQPSCVSESPRNIEACHTGPHGFWQKISGYTCIPLTHEEHMELHRIGPWRFQDKYRIDFPSRAGSGDDCHVGRGVIVNLR